MLTDRPLQGGLGPLALRLAVEVESQGGIPVVVGGKSVVSLETKKAGRLAGAPGQCTGDAREESSRQRMSCGIFLAVSGEIGEKIKRYAFYATLVCRVNHRPKIPCRDAASHSHSYCILL